MILISQSKAEDLILKVYNYWEHEMKTNDLTLDNFIEYFEKESGTSLGDEGMIVRDGKKFSMFALKWSI